MTVIQQNDNAIYGLFGFGGNLYDRTLTGQYFNNEHLWVIEFLGFPRGDGTPVRFNDGIVSLNAEYMLTQKGAYAGVYDKAHDYFIDNTKPPIIGNNFLYTSALPTSIVGMTVAGRASNLKIENYVLQTAFHNRVEEKTQIWAVSIPLITRMGNPPRTDYSVTQGNGLSATNLELDIDPDVDNSEEDNRNRDKVEQLVDKAEQTGATSHNLGGFLKIALLANTVNDLKDLVNNAL